MNFSRATIWMICFLHGSFALLLFIQPCFTAKKKERKHLIVNTISQKPKSSPTATTKKTIPHSNTSSSKPKTTISPPVSPPTPKASSKTKGKPTSSPSTVTSPSQKKVPAIADKQISSSKIPSSVKQEPEKRAKISDALLQELEESIAKLDSKSKQNSLPTSSPTTASISLQIDISDSDSNEASYADLLVNHLRQALQLPSYGEVKIQLHLRQDGSVVKLVVLQAQSKENKRYLEENLPFVRFPRFEGPLANRQESSFILTFMNEV